jgi:hypothetical protein
LLLREASSPLSRRLDVESSANAKYISQKCDYSKFAIAVTTWKCYVPPGWSGGTESIWHDWFHEQAPQTQARHAVVLRFLESGYWREPHFKRLTGKFVGFGEIRINSDKQFRLLGERNNSNDSFLFLLPCFHKDRIYTPKDALKTANRRFKEVATNVAKEIDIDPPQ